MLACMSARSRSNPPKIAAHHGRAEVDHPDRWEVRRMLALSCERCGQLLADHDHFEVQKKPTLTAGRAHGQSPPT
jgi:hypothetical protein